LSVHGVHGADDLVLPFQVEGTGTRGRLARFGDVIDTILSRHAYPEPVARLLGEALVLTAMLAVSLKHEGSLTIQLQGNGPLSFIVCKFNAPGMLRGYAKVADEAAIRALGNGAPPPLGALLGRGTLAITIDPGTGMRRYQGIVALDRDTLAEAADEYFQQSEQIATRVRLAVAETMRADTGEGARRWRAGGLMIQHLAAETGVIDEDERHARRLARDKPVLTEGGEDVEDAWTRTLVLMETVEDHELLDPTLSPERLLYRLYHEDGARVYGSHGFDATCTCTRERIAEVLSNYSRDDLTDMVEEGVIRVQCQFCKTSYAFDPATVGG
jgi:molecular chaperone Hsp33